ncbi:MAG TPA: hypothetical protein PKA64_26415, partial [Myxococcota bacterium]|nr:hypothetical protein [Myxococcota bacterium]
MQWPSPIGVYFLTYVLVILPWLAWRSARALRGPDRPQLTPARVWRSTAVMLSLLGALAWLAGSSFDYPFFAVPHLRAADVGAAGVALALNAVGFFVSRRCRPEDERRRLAVWALSPRTREDWAWALLAIAAASV